MVTSHSFVRTAVQTLPMSNPVTGVQNFVSLGGGSNGFRLSDLPNYTEFVNLFDQYKIQKIDLQFIPSWEGSNKSTSALADVCLPTLVTVEDHNDSALLTSRADYQQYKTYKETILTAQRPITITVRPKPAMAIFGGGVFSSYAQPNDGIWLDTGSYTVDHYGLKWSVIWPLAGTGLAAGFLTVIAKYHLQMRDTR